VNYKSVSVARQSVSVARHMKNKL